MGLLLAGRSGLAGHGMSGQDESRVCQDPSWTRRRVLSLPLWMVALACVGWLPGGVLFPVLISFFDVPLEAGLFGRFFISFTLSGLIAITYPPSVLEFVALRVLYPSFLAQTCAMCSR